MLFWPSPIAEINAEILETYHSYRRGCYQIPSALQLQFITSNSAKLVTSPARRCTDKACPLRPIWGCSCSLACYVLNFTAATNQPQCPPLSSTQNSANVHLTSVLQSSSPRVAIALPVCILL